MRISSKIEIIATRPIKRIGYRITDIQNPETTPFFLVTFRYCDDNNGENRCAAIYGQMPVYETNVLTDGREHWQVVLPGEQDDYYVMLNTPIPEEDRIHCLELINRFALILE